MPQENIKKISLGLGEVASDMPQRGERGERGEENMGGRVAGDENNKCGY